MPQRNYTNINKLLQEIHFNRDTGLYNGFYTTLKNGACSGIWDDIMAKKGITELNKRRWADFGLLSSPFSDSWSCTSEDYLLTEGGDALTSEDGTSIIL